MRKRRIPFAGNVNKIYHIADVHIRNLKRHAEYREVFDRLYNYIETTKGEGDIIVLAGDIVHAKTDMTPEVIEMTQTLLNRLANLLPTVLIPGNHDANLNNPSRLDALSPIVNALKNPNLHYLKDNGAWDMGNVTFVHTSVFSDDKKIIPADSVNGDYKIALYHGPVNKVKTEYGFEIENKNVDVDSFKGYDLTLLGDIHVPNQSLNEAGTIKYCGSTIMQNHGESKYNDHGILVWDVETKKSLFIPIHNDYGYVTLEVEDGEIVGDPFIPEKPRMRVRVKNTSQSKLKKVLSSIRVGRKVQEVSIQKVITDGNNLSSDSSITLQNVRDVGYQNELIKKYLSDKYILGDNQLEIITGINTDINGKLGNQNGLKNIIWKPKVFEFSNMFSYGPKNSIDFTTMKGTYGIFAPNASGKSSLWDALSFCLFDKCSRTSKAVDVMNYAKSKFDCKFNFEINGEDYFIERVGRKSPKRGTVKVDVNFYKINKDGSTESLNGEERRSTNLNIRQYVGSYDDFILTAMSNQNNSNGFIEKSQKERKELLAQFLDMDVFENLYQVANEEIKELSGLLKDYKRQNFTEKLAAAEDELISYNKTLEVVSNTDMKLKLKKQKIEDKIHTLISKLKPVDTSLPSPDILKDKKNLLEDKIELKTAECNKDNEIIDSLKKQLVDSKEKYEKYDLIQLEVDYNKYQEYVELLDTIQKELDKLETDIKHKKTHLEGIGSLSFNDGCEHCITNKNTPFAKQAESLEKEIKELSLISITRFGEFDKATDGKNKHDVTDILSKVQALKSKIEHLTKTINDLELDKRECGIELSKLKSNMLNLNSDLRKSNKQIKSVEYNEDINVKIEIEKNTLSILNTELTDVNTQIIESTGNIKIAENTIKTINDSIDRLAFMENKYEGYEYYLKCVKRDGIPYDLISEILPKLEIEINNILQSIVDFQIILNTDGKNINSYIAYGTEEFWPLELTSGMEKFIASVAIRTALVNVSNLPRPNFIAIDEGFGSLDNDNFNSLYLLFDYLKGQFDFIVTISHIDKTRDMVDNIIDVNKIGGFSSIRYL